MLETYKLNEKEYQNLLNIFKELKIAIVKLDAIKIKDLSNRTIHSASIYQDTISILVAVVIYALSKIIERKKYREYTEWPEFFRIIKESIGKCVKALNEKDFENFSKWLNQIIKSVGKLKGNLKNYLELIFRKARINKGSRVYEHGISFAQTAEVLGITLWELAEYVGQTGISDVKLSITKKIEERLKLAKELFERV